MNSDNKMIVQAWETQIYVCIYVYACDGRSEGVVFEGHKRPAMNPDTHSSGSLCLKSQGRVRRMEIDFI